MIPPAVSVTMLTPFMFLTLPTTSSDLRAGVDVAFGGRPRPLETCVLMLLTGVDMVSRPELTALMFTTPEAVDVMRTLGTVGFLGEAEFSSMNDWMADTDSSVVPTVLSLKDFCDIVPAGETTKDLRCWPPRSITIPLEKRPPRPGEPRNGGPMQMGMGVFFWPAPGGLRSRILTSIWRSGRRRRMMMFLLAESASRMGRSTCSCKR